MRATRSVRPPSEAEPRPAVPYLSSPVTPAIGAELEHPRLAEDGRADARAARVVDEDGHAARAASSTARAICVGGQRLVRHGQPREDEQRRPVERAASAVSRTSTSSPPASCDRAPTAGWL